MALPNNRIYFPVHHVGIKNDGEAIVGTSRHSNYNFRSDDIVRGVQSVGMTTNFNLVPIFQLGQLDVYENKEELPEVEITLNKVLDGHPLMYHMATQHSSTTYPTLIGRSNAKAIFGLSVFSDTSESATGVPPAKMVSSGVFVSNVSYTFGTDDNFTEDVTLVSNHKIWANDAGGTEGATRHGSGVNPEAKNIVIGSTGYFGAGNAHSRPPGTGGVQRREHLEFSYAHRTGEGAPAIAAGNGPNFDENKMVNDPDCTILPPEIHGISRSGTNEKGEFAGGAAGTVGQKFDAHVTNITVNADFGRESINELGQKGPYHRLATFPIEVSTEISAIATSGDFISAIPGGFYEPNAAAKCPGGNNLINRTIRIATCEGTRIYLGLNNKLNSVNYAGGGTDGGNVEVTYSFTNNNDFTVIHPEDPHVSGASWWTNRRRFLADGGGTAPSPNA